MSTTQLEFTDNECARWRRNPTVNPRTGRIIVINGPKYMEYQARCGPPTVVPQYTQPPTIQPTQQPVIATTTSSSRNSGISDDECARWRRNPTVNPITGRNITINGPKYMEYQARCGPPTVVPQPTQPPARQPTQPPASRIIERVNGENIEQFRSRIPLLTTNNIQGFKSAERTPVNSASIENEERITLDLACQTKFNEFKEPFKKFGNKLIRCCDKYKEKKCSKTSLIKLKKDLIKLVSTNIERKPSLLYYTNYPAIASFYIYAKKYYSNSNLLICGENSYMIRNMKLEDDGTEIQLPGIDLGGLKREFFKNITQELLTSGIFCSYNNSKSYFLNPDFRVSEEFKTLLRIKDGYNFYRDSDYLRFYSFIGKLLGFLIINNYGLPFHLSYHILANFIYKPNQIKDEDYVLYMLHDLPDFTNSLFYFMKNPDVLDTYDSTFNEYFKLKDHDEAITKNNYLEYLLLTAKHRLRTNILMIEDTGSKDKDMNEYYTLLFMGIRNPLRKFFMLNKVNPEVIDSLLTYNKLSLSEVSNLRRKFNEVMTIKIRNHERSATPQVAEFLKKYTNYLDKILEKPQDGQSEEDFLIFIEKLLIFWTGWNRFKDTYNYNIHVTNGAVGSLPKSHTCSFQLDVPQYSDQETFYNKLKLAIEETQEGFEIAGGKKTKTKKNKNKNKVVLKKK